MGPTCLFSEDGATFNAVSSESLNGSVIGPQLKGEFK